MSCISTSTMYIGMEYDHEARIVIILHSMYIDEFVSVYARFNETVSLLVKFPLTLHCVPLTL